MAKSPYVPIIPVGEPGGWRDKAACAGHDPEKWFSFNRDTVDEAKRICAGCPVAAQCLEDTLSFPESDDWGIRGGLEEGERRVRRRFA